MTHARKSPRTFARGCTQGVSCHTKIFANIGLIGDGYNQIVHLHIRGAIQGLSGDDIDHGLSSCISNCILPVVPGWCDRCTMKRAVVYNVIKWKHFPRYWPFMRGIHRSPVNSQHKGQWRGALMFSLNCVWINGWVNNREAGDLRRSRAPYDVIVMFIEISKRRYNGYQKLIPTKIGIFHTVNRSSVQQTALHSLRPGDGDFLFARTLVHHDNKSLHATLNAVNYIAVFRKSFTQVPWNEDLLS